MIVIFIIIVAAVKNTSGRRTRSGTGSIYKEAGGVSEEESDSEFEPGSDGEDSSSAASEDAESSEEEGQDDDESEDEYNPFGGSDSDDGM